MFAPWRGACSFVRAGRHTMTPSVVTLQEVLRHHRTLSRRGREFYENLLAHGDVLAVRLDYLPGAMMWLVTTPSHARLMRKAREGRTTSDVVGNGLAQAQGPVTTMGAPPPSWLYHVAPRPPSPAPAHLPT